MDPEWQRQADRLLQGVQLLLQVSGRDYPDGTRTVKTQNYGMVQDGQTLTLYRLELQPKRKHEVLTYNCSTGVWSMTLSGDQMREIADSLHQAVQLAQHRREVEAKRLRSRDRGLEL